MTAKLRERELHPFSARTLHYTARPPAGTVLSDVLSQDYWREVASKLRIGTRIEVLSEDGAIDVDLRVTAIKEVPDDQPLITVRLLRNGYAEAGVEILAEPLTVDFAPRQRWRVKRGNTVIDKDIESRELAEARAKELAA